ncbi:MAG: hypothetical protein ACTSUV_01015 [Candidatus Ranarchaeia archaeon]
MHKKQYFFILFLVGFLSSCIQTPIFLTQIQAQPSGTVLTIDGYDDIELTYDEILSLPNITITGKAEPSGLLNGTWKGVTLKTLTELANGTYWYSYNVTIISNDGYHKTFNWTLVQDQKCFVAYEVNGTPLNPNIHGHLRTVLINGSSDYWISNTSRIVLTPITGDPRLDYNVTITNQGKEYFFTGLNITTYKNITSFGGLTTSWDGLHGPWKLRGINLTQLLSSTGPWTSTCALNITARDGYNSILYFWELKNGTQMPILAYEQDDDLFPLTGVEQGPRIMMVSPDVPISRGDNCPWGISKIEIIQDYFTNFSIILDGKVNYTMDHQIFYEGMWCEDDHHALVNYDGYEWDGIPFWMIVGYVNRPVTHLPYENSSTASATIFTADGTIITIPRNIYDKENNLIIAPIKDDQIIMKKYPLTVVGEGYRIDDVSKIVMNYDGGPQTNKYNISKVSEITPTNPFSIPFLHFNTIVDFSSLNSPIILSIKNETSHPNLVDLSQITPILNLSTDISVETSMTIRIYYTDSQLIQSGALTEVGISAYTYQDGKWIPLETTVNPSSNYVEFTTSEFGLYTLAISSSTLPPLVIVVAIAITLISIISLIGVLYWFKIRKKTLIFNLFKRN